MLEGCGMWEEGGISGKEPPLSRKEYEVFADRFFFRTCLYISIILAFQLNV